MQTTFSLTEEIQVQGQELTSSEQTLYGFEMPLEEAGTMPTSYSFKESSALIDFDQASDRTQPPGEITFRTDETVTGDDETLTADISDAHRVPDDISGEETFQAEDDGMQMSEKQSPSPEEQHMTHSHEMLSLDKATIYPGKRALEVDESLAATSEYATDMLGDDDQEHYFSASDEEFDEYKPEATDPAVDEPEYAEYFEQPQTGELKSDTDCQSEASAVVIKEEEFAETTEEELICLDSSQQDSEFNEKEPSAMHIDLQTTTQLLTDYSDLERPVSPTPDAKQQQYFSEIPEQELSGHVLTPAEERVIEKAASQFVESILEEVKIKVTTPEEPPVDESSDEEEPALAPDYGSESERTGSDAEADDELQPMQAAPPPPTSSLVKQISEDIPEITITQHLHPEEDSDDENIPQYYACEQTEKIEEVDAEIVERETVQQVKCVPEKDDQEEEEIVKVERPVQQSAVCFSAEIGEDSVEGVVEDTVVMSRQLVVECVPEADDDEEGVKEDVIVASTTGKTEMGLCLATMGQRDSTDGEYEHYSVDCSEAMRESVEESLDTMHSTEDVTDIGDSSASIPFLVETDSELVPAVEKSDESLLSRETVESDSGSGTPENEQIPEWTSTENGEKDEKDDVQSIKQKMDESFTLLVQKQEVEKPQDYTDMTSPEDPGDSSSVDSFATVIAAEVEESDDEQVDEEQEDRLADIASMTSSIHSDMQPTVTGETADDTAEDDSDETEEPNEILEWPRPPYERDIAGSESSLDSDRYEFIDRSALSIITEISDEDKFEMIEKEEVMSEGSFSDQMHSSPSVQTQSPDIQSPEINNFKYSKSADRDDISVSSSLLEFENLELQVAQSGSVSSVKSIPDSGSLEDRDRKSSIRTEETASITSSLAEFDRLEQEVELRRSVGSDLRGSLGSVDIITPESNGAGSLSSLSEFDRNERECITSPEDRRGSLDSMGHQSDSSHTSLAEFERIERDIKNSDELETEAQKIVTILESGAFFASQGYASSTSQLRETDLDKDSLGRRESFEQDSLSEGDKMGPIDADSLDGDSSELTEDMTSSVVLAGPTLSVTQTVSESAPIYEVDNDSLQGESPMQLSSDSLGEHRLDPQRHSEKFDDDSLHDQDDAMDRSADSIELGSDLDKNKMGGSADSLEMELQIRGEHSPFEQQIMERSADSLEFEQQHKYDDDSLQEQGGVMKTSADSLELEQSDHEHEQCNVNIMDMSVESAAWSSSGFSHSSEETLISGGSHSDSSHSYDLMQVSSESAEFKKYMESKRIDEYSSSTLSSSDSQVRYTSTSTRYKTTRSFFDDYDDGYTEKKDEPFHFDLDQSAASKTSYISQTTPYQEPKKVYNMIEWEAMKEAKRLAKLAEQVETSPTDNSQLPDQRPTQSHDASDPMCDPNMTSPPMPSSENASVGQTEGTTECSQGTFNYFVTQFLLHHATSIFIFLLSIVHFKPHVSF